MASAAQQLGLSPETARLLAIGTVTFAGNLLADTPDPTELRERVTGPNDTTAAGLAALTAGGMLDRLAEGTLRAAAERSKELG